MLGTALPALTAPVGQDFIAGSFYSALPAQVVPGHGRRVTPPSRPVRDANEAFERQAEALIEAGINDARARYGEGAPRLAHDPVLMQIAEARSRAMAEGGEFSHTDAGGRFIAADMVEARFGPYGATGENILKFGSTRRFDAREFARQAVEGWMQSPGHRKNILDSDFNHSGIGVALIGDTAYATQVFWGLPARDD